MPGFESMRTQFLARAVADLSLVRSMSPSSFAIVLGSLALVAGYVFAEGESGPRKGVAIYAPKPKYTREWAEKGIIGEGVAVLTVDKATGLVTEAHMDKSTGYKVLDDSALEAFRRWRFKPGVVAKTVKIPISFINYPFEKWFIQKHGYPPPNPPKT